MFDVRLNRSAKVELDGMTTFSELFKSPIQAGSLEWGSAAMEFAVAKKFRRSLNADVVEGWLDCSLLQHPFLKVFLDGTQVPVRLFASPRSVKGQVVPGFVNAAKTRSLFADGATLMFCNLHEWHAPCRDLCRSLTDRLAAEVKATAFYSPPGCQGLNTHRDDAHVFIAQIEGKKQWTVFEVASDPGTRRNGPVDPDGCGDARVVTLGPGDGLYLPPYAAHHAQALPSSSSLHLSIAVREPLTRDVIDVAINQVLSADAQRVELSGDAVTREARVREILKFLADRLIELDPSEVVEAMAHEPGLRATS